MRNEKIITSHLARLPEHQLGKEKWQKNKIVAGIEKKHSK